MERTITLEQVVRLGTEALRGSIYVRMPGSVVSYDPTTQTASVQPMINDVRLDLDTGGTIMEPWEVIQSVPVAWPRFGGSPGFVIAGYLKQYDQVILEAFDLDPTPWRAQGRSNNPVDPVHIRKLGGNYWSAIPVDLTGPIADSDVTGGSAIVIGPAGSGLKIVWSGSTINFAGGSPTQAVARVGDMVAGMFAITSGSTKVFAGG